jgi:type I restriction enzyme, S subunit
MKTNNNKGVCDTPQTDTPPQGYKNSPLGIIPEDWEVKRLGEICEIDSRSLSSQTNPDYEFNYISLSDVNNETFEIVTTKQKFSTAPSRARRIVKKGDVIISTVRPNLQGFMQIKNNVENLIVSTGFSVLSPQKCNSDFLYLYVFSQAVTKQFYQLVVGSNYPAVNSSDVVNLKIPLPPLPEQQKIAAILSTWDEAIEKQTAIIEKLTLRKKGLMQQLLSCKSSSSNGDPCGRPKKRLPGFSGEWKEVRLGEITKLLTKGTTPQRFTKTGVLFIKIESFKDDKINSNACLFIDEETNNNELKRSKLEKNDILFAIAGTLGKCAIVSADILPANTNQALAIIRIKETNNLLFIYNLLRSNIMNKYILECKSIGAQPNLSLEQMNNFIFYCPSLSEQTAIAAVLTTADNEISLAKQKLDSLRQQKKGLMQVLLTGKKRVKINN